MTSTWKPFLLYAGITAASCYYFYQDEAAYQQFIEPLTTLTQFIVIGAALLVGFLLTPSMVDEGRVGGAIGVLNNSDLHSHKTDVKHAVDTYTSMFGQDSRKGGQQHEQLLGARKTKYTTMVNHFYDLVTDFYEYGWGPCFHFGQRYIGESFMESIRRTEYILALKLGLGPKVHAADIGCGVGGPLRNIIRFSGCQVTGINNNDYQLKVAKRYSETEGLADKSHYLKCDFMHIPVADGHFDAAYAIEATCHAPDKVGCYSEVYRIIKPGGMFAAYEWCVTPKYDSNNAKHRAIKEGIEQGNSLPELATYDEVISALRQAGFEVLEYYNLQENAHSKLEIPWYDTLSGQYTVSGFRMTRFGRLCTHLMVSILECLCIAPRGATKVSSFLNATADDLVDGGKLDIFTPSFFFLARKPQPSSSTTTSSSSSTSSTSSSQRSRRSLKPSN